MIFCGRRTPRGGFMTNNEFYANILAKVLIDAGAGIIVGGTDSDEIIKYMAETECCEALRKIRDILDDDTFNDEACFYRIHRIVDLFEELGPGGGSRHDFG